MKDPLGDRMKSFYEGISSTKLTRKTPVIMRLDGKAFHTLTRKFCEQKFDDTFSSAMIFTTEFLLSQIQGAKLGYVQSDEISLLLSDYDRIESGAWFDYKVQKMCSVSAAMATVAFNYMFFETKFGDLVIRPDGKIPKPQEMGMFDSRCFNIPRNEVMNYFIWRQQDAMRNSLNGYAQMHFSHKELHGKNGTDVHEMLHTIGKNWTTDLNGSQKNGTFIFKNDEGENVHFMEKVSYDDINLNKLF